MKTLESMFWLFFIPPSGCSLTTVKKLIELTVAADRFSGTNIIIGVIIMLGRQIFFKK